MAKSKYKARSQRAIVAELTRLRKQWKRSAYMHASSYALLQGALQALYWALQDNACAPSKCVIIQKQKVR